MDTGANAGGSGGSGGDCEGEEQEDPSSSSHVDDASTAVSKLNIEGDKDGSDEDELSTFRQQWKRELEATPPQNGVRQNKPAEDANDPEDAKTNQEAQTLPTDFERARSFFLLAADLERAGCWYESILNYKRALAINPNIELLLYQEGNYDKMEEDTPELEEPPEREPREEGDEEEEMVEGEDLLTRIQRIHARKGVLCEPATPNQGMHISWLPYEVVLLVARWVVSSDLDAISLERLGATCRGLYLVARDADLWRHICIRTWGIECGTPRIHGFTSWRQMYLERPRLQLHGCYISKTTYLRHGEASFQDHLYRPWFLVQYYRYLRFFPEGLVVMLTTPDEPGAAVGQLRSRNIKPGQGVMVGHYRLRGDKVMIVMKKSTGEKKLNQSTHTRFRPRRREPDSQERDQTFHIELQLSSPAGRRNMRLSWRGYSVCMRRDQWTEFELSPGKFPAFSFSRVRHYTRESHAPLSTHAARE